MAKKTIRRKKKIQGSSERPRLVIFRSQKYIYCQIINDDEHITLLSASSRSKSLSSKLKKAKTRVEASEIVGEELAKEAVKQDIKRVVFDRNGYKYHGRVQAVAEGARKGGLEF